MHKPIRAKTASDVQRLRSVLAIKLLHNRELHLVGVRQKDGTTTVIECVPKTVDDRSVVLTVPGVTRITVPWEDVMSMEPQADDDDEDTDRPHPFSASDLPFASRP